MSELLYGSICLTDIPQEHISISDKNGKEYLNIAVSQRKEKSRFDETHTVAVSVPKDKRPADYNTIYIGNLKTWEGKPTGQSGASPKQDDDLPF